MPDWKVMEGHCVEVMRSMPENSVDSIVTDPPYGIRHMGKAWDAPEIQRKAETGTPRSSKTKWRLPTSHRPTAAP